MAVMMMKYAKTNKHKNLTLTLCQ